MVTAGNWLWWLTDKLVLLVVNLATLARGTCGPAIEAMVLVQNTTATIEDLTGTANACGTIALNRYEGGKAAKFLEKAFDVPAIIGPTPIGIRNTDTFLQNLKQMTGKPIPVSLVRERGIALDAITDLAHLFFADKRVAIYGNPDLVIGLAIIDPNATLLVAGENGIGKRTSFEEYRSQSRGGKGIITMKTTDRTGKVVGALTVKDDDEIMLITVAGQMVRTRVSDIREAGRNTQGVKLIELEGQDKLQAIAPVISEEKEEADGESEPAPAPAPPK